MQFEDINDLECFILYTKKNPIHYNEIKYYIK